MRLSHRPRRWVATAASYLMLTPSDQVVALGDLWSRVSRLPTAATATRGRSYMFLDTFFSTLFNSIIPLIVQIIIEFLFGPSAGA